MDTEAATVLDTALDSLSIILNALTEWAKMLGDSEAEAIFHINEIARTIDRFVLAIADSEGIEFWNVESPSTEKGIRFSLPVTQSPEE